MKDQIMHKYDIPILRLATNESGEEARMHAKLTEILNGDSHWIFRHSIYMV